MKKNFTISETERGHLIVHLAIVLITNMLLFTILGRETKDTINTFIEVLNNFLMGCSKIKHAQRYNDNIFYFPLQTWHLSLCASF